MEIGSYCAIIYPPFFYSPNLPTFPFLIAVPVTFPPLPPAGTFFSFYFFSLHTQILGDFVYCRHIY